MASENLVFARGAVCTNHNIRALEAHGWVARAFTAFEDIVYVGLGLFLTGIAFTLLVTSFIEGRISGR